MSCVDAAILDATGTAAAAIAVQGPSVRMTPERSAAIGEQLIESAGIIQELLGLDKMSRDSWAATSS